MFFVLAEMPRPTTTGTHLKASETGPAFETRKSGFLPRFDAGEKGLESLVNTPKRHADAVNRDRLYLWHLSTSDC